MNAGPLSQVAQVDGTGLGRSKAFTPMGKSIRLANRSTLFASHRKSSSMYRINRPNLNQEIITSKFDGQSASNAEEEGTESEQIPQDALNEDLMLELESAFGESRGNGTRGS